MHRPDDDGAHGIRDAYDGQRLGEQVVPFRCIELVLRLVQEFEEELRVPRIRGISLVLIMLRDLFPCCDEAVGVFVGMQHQFVVVMIIENGDQPRFLRLRHDPIDAAEKVGVDRVVRPGANMRRPRDRHANQPEPRLFDDREIILLHVHAPGAFLGRLEHVAEVHAMAEFVTRGQKLLETECRLRQGTAQNHYG